MAKYLKYAIQNIEPLRISDDSTSQSGQTDTLTYIPGSAIRGIVINSFAKDSDFEEKKVVLFSSEAAYLNAYPAVEGRTLIPSPKGFYEDKSICEGEKQIDNVVANGPAEPGHKRAGLGRYCYFEDGCIHYYTVGKGADLKININHHTEEKNLVFRSEYISSGQIFEGYIRIPDAELEKRFISIFETGKCVVLGNARSAGMGKCRVISSEIINTCPAYCEAFETSSECYMMLLSDMVMRGENGEYCGLDANQLGAMLGVTNLKIEDCSTSVRQLNGYNRTLGIKLPSISAYTSGSVFKLSFDGVVTADAMTKVLDSGIGVRRNEGLGRVIFLKDYACLSKKLSHGEVSKASAAAITNKVMSPDESKALLKVAYAFYKYVLEDGMEKYVIENKLKLGGISKSRAGTIESLIINNRYKPSLLKKKLGEYFGHEIEKEARRNIQKDKASVRSIMNQINDILDTGIEDLLFPGENPFKENGKIMGIERNKVFNEIDEQRYKINLLISMFKNSRK